MKTPIRKLVLFRKQRRRKASGASRPSVRLSEARSDARKSLGMAVHCLIAELRGAQYPISVKDAMRRDMEAIGGDMRKAMDSWSVKLSG
jgi:hypothetical protein